MNRNGVTGKQRSVRIVAVVSAGLLASLTGTLPTYAATDPTSLRLGLSSADTVLAGVILYRGKPLSSKITIQAWPTTAALKKVAPGARPPLLDVATGSTGATGRFTVTNSVLASLPSFYRDKDGSVAIEVHAQASGQMALFHAQSRPGERTDVAADFGTKSLAQAMLPKSSAVATTSLASDLRAATADSASKAARRVQGLPLTPAVALAPGPCYWVSTNTYKKNVTEFHARVVGTAAAPASLTEVSNTNHDVGIAVKLGTKGWSQTGTSSVGESDENSATTTPTKLSKSWANGVNYRMYGYTCGGSMWRTSGLYSLLKKSKALDRPVYNNCVTYGSSVSKWTKKSGSSWTNGGGVELAGILNLSAKAEWGKDVTVTWTHDSPRVKVAYCGSTSSGPASSPLVESHQA